MLTFLAILDGLNSTVMSIKHYSILLILFSFLFVTACDELGIDPEVSIADCLTEEDRGNYKMFVANEKSAVSLLEENSMDPKAVPTEEREALKNVLLDNIEEHNTLRKGFDCQYWGEDVDFLEILATSGTSSDQEILDPEAFKSLFQVTSPDVLELLSSNEWVGQQVYVFPGISRIPWEGATQSNKEDALRRINDAYNNLRTEMGLEGDVELYDPVNDYLYPHASFHQAFLVQYQSILNNPDDVKAKGLLQEMTSVEEAVIEKIIMRSPDEI